VSFLNSISVAFTSGGIWMWFILGLQIVAIAIIVERVVALYINRKPIQRKSVLNYEQGIRQGDLKTVLNSTNQNTDLSINRTVAAGAHAAINLGGKDEIQGRMEEVILEETEQIDKRTGFLAMIANVATLAGLLGTITGMIKSFAAVSSANPMEKATLLSNGISEAMNTTAFGLIVAIPTLLIYSILANRSQVLTDDLNQAALKAYNWLSYSFNPLEVRTGRMSEAKTEQ
jgi:biopolymer transport protein ExbB